MANTSRLQDSNLAGPPLLSYEVYYNINRAWTEIGREDIDLINRISLRNFQSHKRTDIELHPGVNCIVGQSNSGKTSILRALYWAIYNRPSGMAFVSHWNQDKNGKPLKPTAVFITKNDETDELARIRSADINGYNINHGDGEFSLKLEAVGTDVPEQISSLFNLEEVNIQKQMDAPFLLSESAGEVARFFNRIIRLDLIDRVLAKAESERRLARNGKANSETALKKLTEDSIGYAWVEAGEVLLNKIGVLERTIEEGRDIVDRLESETQEWEEQEEVIRSTKDVETAEKLVDEIEVEQEAIEGWMKKISEMTDLVDQWNSAYALVKLMEEEIPRLEKSLPKTCPLCGGKL